MLSILTWSLKCFRYGIHLRGDRISDLADQYGLEDADLVDLHRLDHRGTHLQDEKCFLLPMGGICRKPWRT